MILAGDFKGFSSVHSFRLYVFGSIARQKITLVGGVVER